MTSPSLVDQLHQLRDQIESSLKHGRVLDLLMSTPPTHDELRECNERSRSLGEKYLLYGLLMCVLCSRLELEMNAQGADDRATRN